MSEEGVCPKCLKPRGTGSAGSLTQWLVVCSCDVEEMEPSIKIEINLCKTCGKRVNAGRSGSFTQFIFRSDLCSCERPELIGEVYDAPADQELDQPSREEEDELDLDLDPSVFPRERYKPLMELGAGASSTVYLARDRILDKLVVVKQLRPMRSRDSIAFNEEARILSRLEHPGIVRVLDFGVSPSGSPYMVLEHDPGQTLSVYLAEHGPIPWETARGWFADLAATLAYAHHRGVFHRDIKPGNLLVTPSGAQGLRLLDFGLAVADDETLVGTPAYMAPDMVNGLSFDERSEIYSVGCVLFECLTGRRPFSADSFLELGRKHALDPIPSLEGSVDPQLLEALTELLERCLAKSPDQRFQTMEELEKAIALVGTPTRSEPEQSESPPARRTAFTGSLVALFLAVILGAGGIYYLSLDKKPERSRLPTPKRKAQPVASVPTFTCGRFQKKNGEVVLIVQGIIRKQDFAKLAAYRDIQALEFDGNSETDWSGLPLLAESPIEKLNLERSDLADSDVPFLLKIPDRILVHFPPAITDDGIKIFLRKKAIPHLWLADTRATGKSVALLAGRADIVDLDLEAIQKLSADDLKVLETLPNLQSLNVSSMPVGDPGMKVISGLGVKRLEADDTNISDRGVEYLSGMKLEFLSLHNNPRLTDRSASYLQRLSTLKILDLADCTGIGPAAIKRLRTGGLEVRTRSRLDRYQKPSSLDKESLLDLSR
ncbi:MAG: serine/threonine protein kinase [Cyanobacteria bacterium HKST-UBA02]|nr:serine/threonine protein kinase [Cyanobacteria bacterium HKST-UBA02]